MPIAPENRALYPADWGAISKRIRFDRAEGRCECRGECGLHPNQRCIEQHDTPAQFAKGQVILTVAHLCHDPRCTEETHLRAMCQRCHLRYDRRHHSQSRARRKDRDTGQQTMFATEPPQCEQAPTAGAQETKP